MKHDVEYTIKNLNREKILKQLLQICSIKDIKTKDNLFSFCVSHDNRKKVEAFLNKKEITILCKKSKGLIAFLKQTIFRWGVIIPIFVFIVFLSINNLFVFNYKIIGNELITQDEVLEVLKQNGAKGIVKKSQIDKQKLEDAIEELDKVSLVSVIIKGNSLVVNIKEKVYNAEYEDKDNFKPLKSEFEGIITEISIVQGTPLVKVGQTVKKGQDLVAPYVLDTSGQILSVKPMADIKADVFLTTITQVPNTKIEMIDTGNVIKTKTISLFGLNVFSNSVDNNFAIFRTETQVEDMSKNLLLPFKIITTKYIEQRQEIIENYFETNREQILSDCQQKTRQLVNSCEIIKEEYNVITSVADINQITHTVVVNKSIC